MLNNDITFSGDGPLMSGTWYNPKTGDSFTVRDTLFEDNQYTVITMDGRVLKYNQLQNYIQTKDPNDIPKSPVKESHDELPAEVASLIDNGSGTDMIPDEMSSIYGNPVQTQVSLGNLNTPVKTSVEDQNTIIINKALSKCVQPTFNVKIDWKKKFPEKEIGMLMELMDISIEEIIDYYIHNMDFNTLASQIANDLTEDILSKFKKEEPKVEEKEPVKKTVKKTTTKKTKE